MRPEVGHARGERLARPLLRVAVALLVASLALAACGPSSGGEASRASCDPAQTAAIAAAFADETVPYEVGAVAMVKDACGKRYFTRGASTDVPEDALHLVGSVTKTYIASLVLLLVEDGSLSLSDPVTRWIPDVPGGDAVQVEHLLNHTSGIFNYTSDETYLLDTLSRRVYTPRELLDIAFSRPPSFVAGEPGKWEYSNTNYVILGMIVEGVTGRPVAQVLRERILEPIGASATFFDGEEPLVGDVAYGESFLGTNGATFLHPSASWCAGNMVSTIGDLVDWTEMRGSGSFHSAAMQAVLTDGVPTPPSPETPWRSQFTYGAALVMVDEEALDGNGPALGHGGDTVGYHTLAYYFPETQVTIAVIVDSDKGPGQGYPFGPTYLGDLYQAVVDAYFGMQRR
ncbi:MAG TPA: serine hydrolase domain-containing protein [Candidatus Binatia bacterium]